MLDIRWIREHSDEAKKRLASRHGGEDAKVDELLELDTRRRALLTEVEQLKAERKAASKEIGALMGRKKLEEAEARKLETKELGDRITQLDKQVHETIEAQDAILLALPNMPHLSVPEGA